ncbi:U-box domain-containing protein 33-like isoform X2 [Gastrolobium bilobum]|uniref:U-box domain-containing protein 33-like isoform X2 n=1 Tax=Gastrolobium bilobum TaxID=150636 RepID=UPI002AAF6EEC|nr:U-box domain-containing protein 33-like isoform X2 [Gastrolobium bilobum]
MAVVCPMFASPHSFSSVNSFRDIGVPEVMTTVREIVEEPNPIGVPEIMTTVREIVEEPNPIVVNDTIYVAVAKNLKDSKSTLLWAIQNTGGKKICILHVHVPASMIPLLGAKFPVSALKEQEVLAYREIERQDMHKTLDDYVLTCQKMGVVAEKLHIEMDCIEKGILELISQYNIQNLVMGAATDRYYSRKMTDIRSKKAIYVCKQAPPSCNIQYICKGNLIHTRDCSLYSGNVEVMSPLVHQMPNSESQSITSTPTSPVSQTSRGRRSQSIAVGQNHWVLLASPAQMLLRRVRSINDRYGRRSNAAVSPEGLATPENRLSYDESDELSRWSSSVFSVCSDSASVEPVMTPNLISEGSENVLDLSLSGLSMIKEDLHHSSSSPPSVLDGGMDDTLYDQLEQAMAEAEIARLDAYQETVRRGIAQKDAIDAIRRAKASEVLYKEELKLRKELEEELEKAKEQIDNMKSIRDKVIEEHQLALDQKSSLENQIASTELMIKDLEEKMTSDADLLQNYKNELDDLKMQRDNALREAEELKRKQGEASSTHFLQLFSEFSFPEIKEATSNFDPSLKIGEGGYGSIFKGILRHTEVAIKALNPKSKQGPSEFQQEVEILSKLRHPNIITLIGACPESWTLVYEYLPNGNLEDRLSCKDNTPPLSWQTRIRIAAELCSALIFLHASKPHSIVHGDLKPSNILLDANLVSKLSDFGICRVLSCQESAANNTTQFWITDPKGSFVYMDPEFLSTCELTPKSDVYSFGIILLELLTGKPGLGLKKEVQCAFDAGKLKSLLDPLAGDWPFEQAEQLTRLALRCCEIDRKSRPELHSDVWRILEPIRASSGGTNTFGLGSQGVCQIPPYFICPILQEVMRDPHVAADGFSYEAEAIQEWLNNGNDTSPRTNAKLEHQNVVPNHAIRIAIQDWLQSL